MVLFKKRNLVLLLGSDLPHTARRVLLGVADEVTEILERILTWGEQRSKRIVVERRVETLLVKSINIDIGSNSVALSLGMRQPRLYGSSNTRIMDSMTTLTKRTVGV